MELAKETGWIPSTRDPKVMPNHEIMLSQFRIARPLLVLRIFLARRSCSEILGQVGVEMK